MVEIAAALSMAGSAYNMIKNGIEKGQEVQDLYQGFTRFFDAKEELAEAAIANSKPSMAKKLFSGSSVEAEALQVTAARHKIAQIEKELRDFLIYSGQMDFYEDMMRERRKIRQRRLAAAQKKAESKKFWTDVCLATLVCAGLAVVVGGIIVIIVSV
jgi:cytochrome c-type biogenesis protein CcmH/NrfG